MCSLSSGVAPSSVGVHAIFIFAWPCSLNSIDSILYSTFLKFKVVGSNAVAIPNVPLYFSFSGLSCWVLSHPLSVKAASDRIRQMNINDL